MTTPEFDPDEAFLHSLEVTDREERLAALEQLPTRIAQDFWGVVPPINGEGEDWLMFWDDEHEDVLRLEDKLKSTFLWLMRQDIEEGRIMNYGRNQFEPSFLDLSREQRSELDAEIRILHSLDALKDRPEELRKRLQVFAVQLHLRNGLYDPVVAELLRLHGEPWYEFFREKIKQQVLDIVQQGLMPRKTWEDVDKEVEMAKEREQNDNT